MSTQNTWVGPSHLCGGGGAEGGVFNASQSSFPVIHNVGNVGIFAALNFN